MRAAILFFGHPRVAEPHNYNLRSLEAYKAANIDVTFDTFMHHWLPLPGADSYPSSGWTFGAQLPSPKNVHQYLVENYKPTRHLFEPQCFYEADLFLHPDTSRGGMRPSDISNMISQMHSISRVCNLVVAPEEYSWFILLRTDCELDKSLPLLCNLNPQGARMFTDVLQIFGSPVFNIYRDLPRIIKEVPTGVPNLSAEVLRMFSLWPKDIPCTDVPGECFLLRSSGATEVSLDMVPAVTYTASLSCRGVYCRRISEHHFICKFPPGSPLRLTMRRHGPPGCSLTCFSRSLKGNLEDWRQITFQLAVSVEPQYFIDLRLPTSENEVLEIELKIAYEQQ